MSCEHTRGLSCGSWKTRHSSSTWLFCSPLKGLYTSSSSFLPPEARVLRAASLTPLSHCWPCVCQSVGPGSIGGIACGSRRLLMALLLTMAAARRRSPARQAPISAQIKSGPRLSPDVRRSGTWLDAWRSSPRARCSRPARRRRWRRTGAPRHAGGRRLGLLSRARPPLRRSGPPCLSASGWARRCCRSRPCTQRSRRAWRRPRSRGS